MTSEPRTASATKLPSLGEIHDVDGRLWDVRRLAPTNHHFPLAFGHLYYPDVAARRGTPHLIATEQLRHFWQTNTHRSFRFLLNLPSSYQTLSKLRNRMGFNFNRDQDQFFNARREDLENLTDIDFAAKHGVTCALAIKHRRRLRKPRPLDWWCTPENLAILFTRQAISKTARRLRTSTDHAFRLRMIATQQHSR